jgi:hypothetical protein
MEKKSVKKNIEENIVFLNSEAKKHNHNIDAINNQTLDIINKNLIK